MNNFTQFINESRKGYDSGSLLSQEITTYLNKVNKILPTVVKDAIYLTKKYNLLDKESCEDFRNANKSSLKQLSTKYNMSMDEVEDMWKILKELKSNIRLMPQYQNPQEREMIELGRLSKDELTIDLETQQGRNAAAKVYMPLAYKIIGQYVGKSKLSRQELMSAALEAMTNAMNDWRGKDSQDDRKKVSFKTYLSYRIQQQILNDINQNSHELSGFNDYAKKQGYSADATSLDGLMGGDGDSMDLDHIMSLSYNDKEAEDEKDWNYIYRLIDNHFTSRESSTFYRYWGMNGYKKEKNKDLAKELGMSEGNVKNVIINKILKYLKTNSRAQEILAKIADTYNESLMLSMWGMDKDMIEETFINDDTFILLEELNRWNNKELFIDTLENALNSLKDGDKEYILDVLENDFEFLDGAFKKHKKVIVLFLNNMYPTETMNRKTDVALLEYMNELQEMYKKYKK